MSHEVDQPTPVIPARLRTVLYVVGVFATGIAAAVVGEVPDVWVRLGAGFGTAALGVAFGYRPTR